MTQPTDPLLPFATDAVFASGPTANVGLAVRVALSEAQMLEGVLPGTKVRGQHINSIIGKLVDELIHRRDDVTAWIGDASDGDATLTAGNTTLLSADTYYGDLVIDAGATLVFNGFRLFGRYIEVNGTLNADGEDGVDYTPGAPDTPGVGGAGAASGSVQGGTSGGDGAAFGGNDGDNGGDSSIIRLGSQGDNGDDFAANVGGSRGSASAPTASQGGVRDVWAIVRGFIVDLSGSGAVLPCRGGTGGGGGASGVSAVGGGGGGGGGLGIVAANEIVVGATGIIRCNGGAAGAGSGGDGGYGGSGALNMLYRRLTVTPGGLIQTLNGDATDGDHVVQLRV